jgi:hypothetical protein
MTARRLPGIPVAWAFALLVLAILASVTEARPGGGQGYSGGGSSNSSSSSGSSSSSYSSSSRSGSSSSGGGGSFLLVVGVVIVGLCIEAIKAKLKEAAQGQSWNSPSKQLVFVSPLEALREQDPDFSLVLFEDFAFALFARAHGARHSEAALAGLSPYLAPGARTQLLERHPVATPVRAVVIGSLRIAEGYPGIRDLKVELVFEANLVLAAPDGDLTHYVRERWYLCRPLGVRTRPWKGVRTFGCPACGAPLETGVSSICTSCGQPVDDGKFDWKVQSITVEDWDDLPPSLTGTVEEKGTNLPTVFTPGFRKLLDALLRDDPAFTLEALDARLRLIFEELQKAWAMQDLSGIRPFISAGLYQYLDYWVAAYRTQGLRNEVEGATLEMTEIVRVVRDTFYDSLTVRIRGSGRDFTVRTETGEVVGGSRTDDRRYTEYWTLIRGAQVRGAPRADRSCPTCNGAVKVGMEGNCAYCGALVTAGDFDWVLSRIEQDDSYTG